MNHSFLLVGQSNMAGRGFAKEVPVIYDERIKVLCNGRWQTMWEPIHHDRPSAGVGLASSFAAAWRLQHPADEIGLIPCADGGTSLDDWAVGGVLFDNAVYQARLAQRESRLAGILWHQGENDCTAEQAAAYTGKLSAIVAAFRRELQDPALPVLVGGLGDYLPHGRYGTYFAAYSLVNQALQAFATTQPNSYFVTATGLTANPDGLHFNAQSLRLLGLRYFAAFDERKQILAPLASEQDLLARIYDRPLSQAEAVARLEQRFACGELSLEELTAQLAQLRQ